jgi:coenzyme F420-reducing hydrogenase alpha subunit
VTPAGEIHIELTHRAGQVRAVKIRSTRPEAARVLIGKTPEQVLNMVPLLFSLCGNAQAYVALLACRATLELDADPEADAARECLVQLETVREHAWRILLDWRGLLCRSADKIALAALLKLDRQFKSCLFKLKFRSSENTATH